MPTYSPASLKGGGSRSSWDPLPEISSCVELEVFHARGADLDVSARLCSRYGYPNIPSHRVSLVPLLVSSLPLVAFPEREMKLLDGPPVQPSPVGPSVQAFLVGPRGKARGWSQGDAHAESLNEAGALHPSLTSLRGWSPTSCQ